MSSATHPRISSNPYGGDLLADEAAFFSKQISNSVAPENEDAIASFSLAKNKPTNTEALLVPIKERRVRRRVKRMQRGRAGEVGFPSVEVGERGFGKKHEKGKEQGREVGDCDNVERRMETRNAGSSMGGGNDVDEMIRGMSPEEIQQAIAEIEGVLSEDTIRILRERKKGDAKCVEGRNGGERDLKLEKGEKIGGDAEVVNKDLREGQRIGEIEKRREKEKLLWMTDAREEVEGQGMVDALLDDAITELGPLGEKRFNLEGDVLTKDEVEQLPMHLGLHHHGSEPTQAGYTLAELLLLTRSSVVTQRVMALRIVAHLVERYGEIVVGPLVKSGGLALVFAQFPAGFDESRTVQMEYVSAVQSIIGGYWEVDDQVLVPDLYFASRFYSELMEEAHPCFEVLAKSGCLDVLAKVARANVRRGDEVGLARRSLAVMRAIVKNSLVAGNAVVIGNSTMKILSKLVCEIDHLEGEIVLLACDVIAQAVVAVGWEGGEAMQIIEKSVLGDAFLDKVSVHLRWFSTERTGSPQRSQYQAALGVIRLFRAALAFERGVMAFTASAQTICLLTRHIETSTEAFLALEAYAQALYVLASPGEGDEMNISCAEESGDQHRFATNQLGELVPVAIAATKVFSSLRNSCGTNVTLRKAAAGHFAATLFATTTMLLDKVTVVMLFNECGATSRDIQSHSDGTRKSLFDVQALASVSHAGARLLTRVHLDPLFARREVASVMAGVDYESRVLGSSSAYHDPWRPVANACAEWVTILAKADSGKKTALFAVELLPLLFDSQVILDILSRCILMTKVLTQVSKSTTAELARKCAADLLPFTLPDLRALSEREDCLSSVWLDAKSESENRTTQTSLKGLMEKWSEHAEVADSVLHLSWAFFEGGILAPVHLFQCLLKAPSHMRQWQNYFSHMFYFAKEAVASGECLVGSVETMLSAISTSPNSVLSDSLLSLAEDLVSRGPQMTSESDHTDHLASIIITVMCSKGADVGLRQSLWQKTVLDCGGGALFKNALYLPLDCRATSAICIGDEEDAVLTAYCAAVVDGFLLGERCPSILGSVIVSRLEYRLEKVNHLHALDLLRGSLRDRKQTCALETLQDLLQSTTNSTVASPLTKWIHEQMVFRQ